VGFLRIQVDLTPVQSPSGQDQTSSAAMKPLQIPSQRLGFWSLGMTQGSGPGSKAGEKSTMNLGPGKKMGVLEADPDGIAGQGRFNRIIHMSSAGKLPGVSYNSYVTWFCHGSPN